VNARQGVVVEPTSFLVKGDAIGMRFRRFASLRVDNFHAVDDNFCARFDFGGRMISQQSTGLTGFQIDDHNCSVPLSVMKACPLLVPARTIV
jgi:hypothetical protein